MEKATAIIVMFLSLPAKLSSSRCWLTLGTALLIALLSACTQPELHLTLPGAIDGGWTRGDEESFESAGIHESLQRLSVVEARTATYHKGNVSIRADVYHMPNSTMAFEALQTYPRGAGEYYYHVGASFIVLHLDNLPPDERRPFLLAFQAATQPKDGEGKAE